MKEITERDWAGKIKNQQTAACFIYSPLCGTCGLAEKMLAPVEALYTDLKYFKINVNYIPSLTQSENISSVPCLKLYANGTTKQTIYAFSSVPALAERIESFLKEVEIKQKGEAND